MTATGRLLLFIVLYGFTACAKPKTYDAQTVTSYERVVLPGDEPMGLTKAGVLFRLSKYLWIGPELYGAVTGKRGGFFTAGMEARLQNSLTDRVGTYGGLFVGAGGGGSAPQGGGLMIRPSVGLSYDAGYGFVEGGIGRVWYPNGKIDSTQFHVGFSLNTSGKYVRGNAIAKAAALKTNTAPIEITTQALMERYIPSSSSHDVRSSRKTTPFSLAGIEFMIRSGDRWYGYLEAAGAGAGKSNGYMELFGGLGADYHIKDDLTLGMRAAVGAAGGGRVDTGGGLMYRADVTVQTTLYNALSLGGHIGKIGAVQGSFSASSYGITLGYREKFYGLGDPDFSVESGTSAWRFTVQNKSYLPFVGMFKDNQLNRIDLIGLSLYRFLGQNFYLIGESFWAWQGQAGGYAEGVLGMGIQSSPFGHLSAYAEAKAGVGGGGDVHMDGGLYGAIEAGIRYDIDQAWQLHAGAGYIRSRTGVFHTYSIHAGIGYNFSLFGP
jgi:hypothetical protein